MSESLDAFTQPEFRRHARLALDYIDVLFEADSLRPTDEVTLGEMRDAKVETLAVLGKLARYSIKKGKRIDTSLLRSEEFMTYEGDEPGMKPNEILSGGSIKTIETPISLMVRRARRLDATWSEIGQTLGMSAQGAHKAYSTGIFDPLD
jgi:hypothetical protein